jgi:hypothetical protein
LLFGPAEEPALLGPSSASFRVIAVRAECAARCRWRCAVRAGFAARVQPRQQRVALEEQRPRVAGQHEAAERLVPWVLEA